MSDAAAEVERLAGLAARLLGTERHRGGGGGTGDPYRMTRLGAGLLEDLLAANAGHPGPRVTFLRCGP